VAARASAAKREGWPVVRDLRRRAGLTQHCSGRGGQRGCAALWLRRRSGVVPPPPLSSGVSLLCVAWSHILKGNRDDESTAKSRDIVRRCLP